MTPQAIDPIGWWSGATGRTILRTLSCESQHVRGRSLGLNQVRCALAAGGHVHIRLPWEGPVRIRSLKPPLVRLIERFLAADGQNALGTKVSQKPKYSSSFLPCQSLLLTLCALRVTQIIGRSTLQALEDLPSCEERCCCTGGGLSLSDVDRDGTLPPLRGARRSNPPVR